MQSFLKISPDSHFPIQNIPFGIFKKFVEDKPRAASRIGDYVIDLSLLEKKGYLKEFVPEDEGEVFSGNSLNKFMGLKKGVISDVRKRIQTLMRNDCDEMKNKDSFLKKLLTPIEDCRMLLPVEIGDYTDFYSSKEHATNVGIMFRGKENALMPNWLHLPVAYHGRASSIVVSGTDVIRPKGQTKADDEEIPHFGPSKLLDFELEMGFFIGKGNELGKAVPVKKAQDHIFGFVLVNDWSARDIQKWEYVPLGPFLAKNFATSISPWIVTLEALEPFKIDRQKQDPKPLPYLRSTGEWHYDINLEVSIRCAGTNDFVVISKSNFKHLYWDICQQLAHHTVTGCNLRTGDLLASGTISGPASDSFGSLLELTWKGTKPLNLASGETRRFLMDGDTLRITGWCQGKNYRIGFGEVTGKILPTN